jgi:sulfur carrier protein ThiS
MVVEIKLFATFRECRFKERTMEFPDESSLGELLKHLKISEKQVGILLVNGQNVSVDYKLAPHDVVSIFPLIGGG